MKTWCHQVRFTGRLLSRVGQIVLLGVSLHIRVRPYAASGSVSIEDGELLWGTKVRLCAAVADIHGIRNHSRTIDRNDRSASTEEVSDTWHKVALFPEPRSGEVSDTQLNGFAAKGGQARIDVSVARDCGVGLCAP